MSARAVRPQTRAAWFFLAPALGLIGFFFFLPVASGLLLSLTDFDVYSIGAPETTRFVGIDNYAAIVTHPDFRGAVRNTLYYVIVGAPLSVLVSLATALLVSGRLVRWRGLLRTVFFMPVVTTLVAVAIVWRYVYHPKYGLANHALGFLGLGPVDWLGDPLWAMPAMIGLAVWKTFGYNMIIFVAGLQVIPQTLYESAALEGAGAWRRFVHITFPGLAPVFLFVSVTTMIGFFQLFAEPYVMTQGGPLGSTRSLVLLMYEEGFRWWRMGVASSLAAVLLVITLIGTLIQLRLSPGRP